MSACLSHAMNSISLQFSVNLPRVIIFPFRKTRTPARRSDSPHYGTLNEVKLERAPAYAPLFVLSDIPSIELQHSPNLRLRTDASKSRENLSCQDILSPLVNGSQQQRTKQFGKGRLQVSVGNTLLNRNHNGKWWVQQRGFKTKAAKAHGSMNSLKSLEKVQDMIKQLSGSTKQPPVEAADPLRGPSMLADGTTRQQGDVQNLKTSYYEGYLNGIKVQAKPKSTTWSWGNVFMFVGILGVVWYYFGRTSFRISFSDPPSEVMPEEVSVTFNDVKGIEEAKDEVMEIVEYLRDPEKFSRLGGRLPKGVLLVGPPGTGKTLLARAIAGEANVPFFHASGSEFDEVLVGQGAKRIRELFATAKERAPCVIFIDEIDSVGQKRTSSSLHPYANQTVNQLLAEMDGFKQNEGVIVLGASNRRDDLDQALLRPGRFDVQVYVSNPDLRGRREILSLYLGKITVNDDVNIETLAKGTTGFTGADLENLVNQAALRAAADGRNDVDMEYLDAARDKVMMGPEKKYRIPDEEVNKVTAYHEAGHTLCAYYSKYANPVHKVTIIPRGQSLGHTSHMPDKEMYGMSRGQLMATMVVLMGGRAAEDLIFGIDDVTTGPSDDLEKATNIAKTMVKDLGMSDKVGLRTFKKDNDIINVNDLSPTTAELIDSEIKRLLTEAYDRAKTILKTHAAEHKRIAETLLEYETLDLKEITSVIEGNSSLLNRVKH